MNQCPHTGCSWQAIAPSADAATTQYVEHFVTNHARTVDVDIPDGMVQVKLHEDGEWITTTAEAARELQQSLDEE